MLAQKFEEVEENAVDGVFHEGEIQSQLIEFWQSSRKKF